MRLQRLEIAGFKSFSDPSELSFDKGVTAIVGPNGCGKSNVADAITWVLGEQSAKSLRGDRMEDVIFSGSDARKPTGAAEVKLLLTDVTSVATFTRRGNGNGRGAVDGVHGPAVDGNGNGHHGVEGHAHDALIGDETGRAVEVTRRLYRSGESEYLIDGEVCRLRDVHELLMDTGLGAKAYAIIEQGKIGMILSSRPTDRRQLIEEAAGVTKYKARRRAAELKLEASQQNLTRIDDIIFEVDKQRGALKRQAAKARRYKRLRDEQRRWEKVLFARRYRELAGLIESTRARLSAALAEEAAVAARLAAFEGHLGSTRITLAEAEAGAKTARDRAHARELEINRHQQQIEFGTEQAAALRSRCEELTLEIQALELRREPGDQALAERRQAASRAVSDRDEAARTLRDAEHEYATAHQTIEGLEGDVEAARSEVFAAINAATALRHAVEHAGSAQERVAETLAKLDVEDSNLRIEADQAAASRQSAVESLTQAQAGLDETRVTRAARESRLTTLGTELERCSRDVRNREQDLAGLRARLASLEELDASRAGYDDAARMVLAEANEQIAPMGSVADFLETDRRYERAVENCLGDLLQHVLVNSHEQAVAGLELVRSRQVGRCGFLVASSRGRRTEPPIPTIAIPGVVSIQSVVRITGHVDPIRRAIGEAWVAEDFESALEAARDTTAPVATLRGDVIRGAHRVTGGGKGDSRGILATKREIKELRDRVSADAEALRGLAEEAYRLDQAIADASGVVDRLMADEHHREKAIVGYELQLARAEEEALRLGRKRELVATERRAADEERRGLTARQAEAQKAIGRLEAEQRAADERLALAQRRLFEAREGIEGLSHAAADAMAAHATLVERAAGLATEVQRFEEAVAELRARVAASRAELRQNEERRGQAQESVRESQRQLDEAVKSLDALRGQVRSADETVSELLAQADGHERAIRDARRVLEEVRASLRDLEVARATAETDLTHLASACLESVQAGLDAVLAEVERLEEEGTAVPDSQALGPDEVDEAADEEAAAPETQPVDARQFATLTAEEAIAQLRAHIDRLGPVNMMAIEQFDELDSRHGFLTTQRKDLVGSIAATGEAIKRIDETTKERFREAFAAINANFQETFSTLFGGGQAGLRLLDEQDVLESGIEIIAQPPGKRLQSVQLLSGGEKALAAIALMFGIFKYKPSPFCLLDEIDAPLDDANIGRFIEMLRGMLADTQFILITHNRKTMEIADRLYGVTMEEPGVSKLISVRLH